MSLLYDEFAKEMAKTLLDGIETVLNKYSLLIEENFTEEEKEECREIENIFRQIIEEYESFKKEEV